MEKLAIQTGVWPLKESVEGVVKHTVVPRSLTPVKDYLKTQERFEHLFKPVERTEGIATIQKSVNDYWAKAASEEGFQVRLAEA